MVTEDILQFFLENLILHFYYQQVKKFLSIHDDIYFFDYH